MDYKKFRKELKADVEKWKKNLSPEERFFLKVADQIIEARVRLGMTQEKLAKKLGKHQSAIARIENAKTKITNTELLKIAKVLGIELLPPRFVFNNKLKVKAVEHKRVK